MNLTSRRRREKPVSHNFHVPQIERKGQRLFSYTNFHFNLSSSSHETISCHLTQKFNETTSGLYYLPIGGVVVVACDWHEEK